MTNLSDFNAAPAVDTAASHVEPVWYFADGVPGQGDRPDYLEPKYKTVAEQARAYKEAQKLIGAQASAPESYDYSSLQEYIDQDNQYIKEYAIYAKENRFSQDAFVRSLKTLVDYDKSKQPDVDQEIAKLGDGGMQRVETVQNWVKNNLTAESAAALSKLPVRAEVVKMLDEIRQLHVHNQARIPVGEKAATTFVPLTLAEVEAEMMNNYPRYQTDAAYRAQLTAKFEQVSG